MMGIEQESSAKLFGKKLTRRKVIGSALGTAALAAALALVGCRGETEENLPQIPPATQPAPESPSPEALTLEFPEVPPAPEGVSGEDSLADLMNYLDGNKGPIESKDYMLKEGGRIPEDPRINFEVRVKKPGGIWAQGDAREFEQKRDAFVAWIAERRRLSGEDCYRFFFTIPSGHLLKFATPTPSPPLAPTPIPTSTPNITPHIERAVACPESSGK